VTAAPNIVLLDTHAAIWFVAGTLEQPTADIIIAAGRGGGALISPISAWEIGMLGRPRGNRQPRMVFDPDPRLWFDALMAKPIFRPAPFTPEIAIAASFLPGTFHDDPADRLLVATARDLNVPIVTRDRRILAYAEAGHVGALAC
jgi:PIN domain nuclease of toxin-antitoxin system